MTTTVSTVIPIWQALQGRFYKTVKALPEQDLSLQQGTSTIGSMLYHNAEVEYMFAEWFFGKSMPEHIKLARSQEKTADKPSYTNLAELVDLIGVSNEHLIEAMKELPEEAWHVHVESPAGGSTPLEAVGRLMYHTGIHAGQISLIQKQARAQASDA